LAATLATLRTRAQRRADLENSNFVGTAEWTDLINEAYVELWDLLVAAYADWFLSSSEFTLSGSTSTQALPADFYKLVELDYVTGPGTDDFDPVPRFTFRARNRGDRAYRVMGNLIRISPATQAPGTYRAWYIQGPTLLVNDADSTSALIPTGMAEQFIPLVAGIKANTKQKKDSSELERELARLTKRIETMTVDRDTGEPTRILEVDDPLRGFGVPRLPPP